MFAVFATFVPAADSTIKPIAIGLAVGVLVDAFVVRMTLVPAVLTLLGYRAWALPAWLDRLLPSLDIEGQRLIALRDAVPCGDVPSTRAADTLRTEEQPLR